MEVIPGKRLGDFLIGDKFSDVVEKLNCSFKYDIRGNISVLAAKSYMLVFDANRILTDVSTIGSTKAKYHGIGYNSKIKDVVSKFGNVTVNCEGCLMIESHPGITFQFSNNDAALLYESGVHAEGLSDFVSDVKVKHVCVHDFERFKTFPK